MAETFETLMTTAEVQQELGLTYHSVRALVSRGLLIEEQTRLGRFITAESVAAYKPRVGKRGRPAKPTSSK